MDFSKFRSGAIDFADFLVGNGVWFSACAASFYFAYPEQLPGVVAALIDRAIALLNTDPAKGLIDTYGLKSTLPILAFFGIIFIMQTTKRALLSIGSFVPPEIVLDHIPARADIRAHDLETLALTNELDVRNQWLLIETEYDTEFNKNSWDTPRYRLHFAMFKGLASINFILFLSSKYFNGNFSFNNLWITIAASACAFISGTVFAYRSRMASRWAVYRAIKQIQVSSIKRNLENGTKTPSITEKQRADFVSFTNLSPNYRWLRLGASIPIVGNLRILWEFYRDHPGRVGTSPPPKRKYRIF